MTRPKNCAVCKKPVSKGEGQIYRRKLIHKTCKTIAKIQGWRFFS